MVSINIGLQSLQICSAECSEENHRQCIKKLGTLLPQCECQAGYTLKDNKCQECDFGYSGVDCKDNIILIFTVACAVGGAILLGTIIGLIVLARSKKKAKDGEREDLISRGFSNMRLETTGFNNPGSSPGGLFPKVNATPFPRVQSSMRSNPYDDPYSRRSIPVRDY
ncbi:mucin-13 [Dromiciops gliroides]|uniref:mucin-13 n=1 Tax=Dromiciops gliroides TaxID=33562 RepID=UPI001CC683CD|nr:mucin-13 [Dromiciops gliroides]